jgi:hypothetical protein
MMSRMNATAALHELAKNNDIMIDFNEASSSSCLPPIPEASPIPVASAVVAPKRRPVKVKPVVAVAEKAVAVAEKAVAEADAVESVKVMMIKKSDYDALLARVEALESKKRVAKESQPAKAAVRVSTKDAILRDMLEDGEKVYAKELINDGDEKGEYRTWSATFHRSHNGFLIDECDNERIWKVKGMYAMSPTTLCSRFRYIMNQNGQSVKNSSTCCGFAKCYVKRNGVEMRLNTLL